MSACMRFSFPNSPYSKGEGRLVGLLEGLLSVYSEQQLTTKEAAGNCIAVAIRPLPPMIPIQITGNIRSMVSDSVERSDELMILGSDNIHISSLAAGGPAPRPPAHEDSHSKGDRDHR